MSLQDLADFKRDQSDLDIACLTMFNVARELEFPRLPISVHVYLSGLTTHLLNPSMSYINPDNIITSKDDVRFLIDSSISMNTNSTPYNKLKTSGNFYINFGAFDEVEHNNEEFNFQNKLEDGRKAKIELVGECYLGAATFSRRMHLKSESVVYQTISYNPEMYYDLLVAFYSFKKTYPDFIPSDNLFNNFHKAYVASQIMMELDRQKQLQLATIVRSDIKQ